jgi:hypothetical protein
MAAIVSCRRALLRGTGQRRRRPVRSRGERLNVRRSQRLPPADAAQSDLAALAFAFTASIWAFAWSLHAF